MIIDQLRMLDETLTIETALSKGVGKDSPFYKVAECLYPHKNIHNSAICIKRKISKIIHAKSNVLRFIK